MEALRSAGQGGRRWMAEKGRKGRQGRSPAPLAHKLALQERETHALPRNHTAAHTQPHSEFDIYWG